jgi:hypothetical protein
MSQEVSSSIPSWVFLSYVVGANERPRPPIRTGSSGSPGLHTPGFCNTTKPHCRRVLADNHAISSFSVLCISNSILERSTYVDCNPTKRQGWNNLCKHTGRSHRRFHSMHTFSDSVLLLLRTYRPPQSSLISLIRETSKNNNYWSSQLGRNATASGCT